MSFASVSVVALGGLVAVKALDSVQGQHKIIGMNPKFSHFYEPISPPQYGFHQFFQCDPLAPKGNELVPFDSVNDDFCDCSNGADEPGTAACSHFPGAAFFCANKGSVPKLIWSSHVGDGVCDCCDGSDEWQLGGCADRCLEEGAKVRKEREAELQLIEAGLKQKEEERAHTEEVLVQWKQEILDLQAKLPSLESTRDSAQVVLDQRQTEFAAAEDEKKNKGEVDVLSGGGDDDQDTSEYAKWMEKGDGTQSPLDIAREEVNRLSDDVTSAKERIEKHETNLKTDFGVDFAYFSLANKCVEAKFDHYNYEICFFGKITQSEAGKSSSGMSLGKYSKYYVDAEKSETPDYSIHVFEDGDWCPGGPARSVMVKVRCGPHLKMVSVQEPSRCKYEAVVTHPGSCSAADVDSLKKHITEDNAIVEGQYMQPHEYITHASEEL